MTRTYLAHHELESVVIIIIIIIIYYYYHYHHYHVTRIKTALGFRAEPAMWWCGRRISSTQWQCCTRKMEPQSLQWP